MSPSRYSDDRLAQVVLLAVANRTIDLGRQLAACFTDHRLGPVVRHSVGDLLRQQIFDIALGHEDLIDHDTLRDDPALAAVLMCAVRRIGLAGTKLTAATCGKIRLKLLKIGALVTIGVRRAKLAFASACPEREIFELATRRL